MHSPKAYITPKKRQAFGSYVSFLVSNAFTKGLQNSQEHSQRVKQPSADGAFAVHSQLLDRQALDVLEPE